MTSKRDRIYVQYQIISGIGLLLLTGVFLAGCAATPYPSVEVYMEPVEGRFNAQIDPETAAATVEKRGVAVTIEPVDAVELFALTEDPNLNPYLIVERNGAVEPIYTVFGITVHNRDHRRVLVDDIAVLIDGKDTQYANLSSDYFDSLYDDVDLSHQNPYVPLTYPSYYGYHRSYVDTEALEWGRIVIADSIFESGKLFSGARRSGLLVFDRLPSDMTDVRIVVPEVRIIHSDGKADRLQFKFDFRQVLQQNSE